MNTIGLFYNTKNLAVTQFENFGFKGLGLVGDDLFAVNEEGIFQLSSGTLDNGEKIASKIVFGPTDFGIPSPKRVRVIDISARLSGSLKVTVSDEKGASFTVEEATRTKLFEPEKITFFGNRNVLGRFLTFTLESIEGCDFELLDIYVNLTIMRPGQK